MKGRALTPEQKRAIVERLLAAWLKMPEQRLGQLILNPFNYAPFVSQIEDEYLAEHVERFVEKHRWPR